MRGKVLFLSLALTLILGCQPAAPVPTPAPKAAAVPTPTVALKPTLAPTPTPTKAPPEKVVISYPSESLSFWILFLARDKGYFNEEGLDVELQRVSPSISIKAMLSGTPHFDASLGSGIVSIVQGAPNKVVVVAKNHMPWYVMSRPEIKSIEGLKGKTIALDSRGAAPEVAASMFLRLYGLDPDKDVSFLGVGPGGRRAAMTGGGAAAATLVADIDALALELEGFNRLAFIGDRLKGTAAGLTTTEKMIKERPQAVKRVVRAYLKSLKFFKSQNPEARAYFERYADEFAKLDKNTASKLYDTEVAGFTDTGVADEESMKGGIEINTKGLGVTVEVTLDKVFDLSFVKAANEELKREGWKP